MKALKGPRQMVAGWDNPDVGLLYDINGLARHTPGWLDRGVALLGEHGLLVLAVLMLLGAWWFARRRPGREEATVATAGVVWAGLAGCLAYLVNVPIREFVARPRPSASHQGLEILVNGKTGYSFVSDHSSAVMAVAVGLYMVNRRLGLFGLLVALLQGLSRIYVGVHYPTDVVGGLALGTAVALLLAPGGMAALTPLSRWLAGTPLGWLVRARPETVDEVPGDAAVSTVDSRRSGSVGGAVSDSHVGDSHPGVSHSGDTRAGDSGPGDRDLAA